MHNHMYTCVWVGYEFMSDDIHMRDRIMPIFSRSDNFTVLSIACNSACFKMAVVDIKIIKLIRNVSISTHLRGYLFSSSVKTTVGTV